MSRAWEWERLRRVVDGVMDRVDPEVVTELSLGPAPAHVWLHVDKSADPWPVAAALGLDHGQDRPADVGVGCPAYSTWKGSVAGIEVRMFGAFAGGGSGE